MKTVLFPASALVLAALVTGCGSAPIAKGMVKGQPERQYAQEKERLEKSNVVCPGFSLRITHSADEELSGDFKVNFKGLLRLPYKITLHAAGQTTAALASAIEKAYSPYFKVRNTVGVDIIGREYLIEVRGLVQKPGIYGVKLDTSLEEIVALAGGMPGTTTESAPNAAPSKPEYVRVVRPDYEKGTKEIAVRWVRLTDYFLKYDVRNESLWQGGEQLFFQITGDPEAARLGGSSTIQILGEVHKPGEYPIQDGADLYTYLTQAGGPTSTADMTDVTVIHKTEDDSDSFNLTSGTKVVELKPGDAILIKSTQTRPGFFERLGPMFISAGSLVVSVVLVLIAL